MKIGILVAMEVEFRQLVRLMEDAHEELRRRLSFTVGRIGSHEVVLMKCGIGKVNAAMGSTVLIDEFQPDCVVSTGCAGGIDDSLRVMDVVVSRELVYHDVDCGEALGCPLGQVQGLPRFFQGDERLLRAACAEDAESSTTHGTPVPRARIHAGLICTGDQFVTSPESLAAIKRNFPDGLAVDMESCAIAQVCYLQGVPFVSFRVISDTPGADHHQQQYEGFWQEMADRSFGITKDFLMKVEVRGEK